MNVRSTFCRPKTSRPGCLLQNGGWRCYKMGFICVHDFYGTLLNCYKMLSVPPLEQHDGDHSLATIPQTHGWGNGMSSGLFGLRPSFACDMEKPGFGEFCAVIAMAGLEHIWSIAKKFKSKVAWPGYKMIVSIYTSIVHRQRPVCYKTILGWCYFHLTPIYKLLKMGLCLCEVQLRRKVRPLQKENLGDRNKLISMGALFCHKKHSNLRFMANMGAKFL